MAENFDLIFGQNASQQYAWNDADYQNGWETIGNIPPTAAQFDALQRRSDTKLKELNDELTPLVNADTADSRQPSTTYSEGDIKYSSLLPTGWFLTCTTAGTTSASELVLPSPIAEKDTVTDGTVTWTIRKIGSGEELTVVDSIVPTSNQGTVAEIINGVANMLKQIKGDSDWKTAPVISLTSILNNLGTNFEVTTDERTGVFSVPALGITGLMAQNGYVSLGRLFGGLILQWGNVVIQSSPNIDAVHQITLPIAFTSIDSWACSCSCVDGWAAGTYIYGCNRNSNSKMNMGVMRSAGATPCGVTWMAMGY